jgi:hypothetical protein
MGENYFDFVKNIEFGVLRAQFTVQDKYLKKFSQHLFFSQDVLYHYTDLNGLVGILENKGFWLSEAKYLNDKEELYNGSNLTIELLQTLLKKPRYLSFQDILLKVVTLLKESKFKNYYIASFSSKVDDLEQWRAYSKNGSGVCIGFNVKQKTAFPHFMLGPVWMLHKVIYEDKIKYRILHLIIFKYFHEFKKDLKEHSKYIDMDDYATSLARSLTYTFINFKHNSFAQEKEVRLVCQEDDVLKHFHKKHFRAVNNIIVPYVCTYDIILKHHEDGSQIEPELLPVSEIYIGPKSNQNITIESIENFISDLGYSENIVKSSKIPYRG